MTDRTDELGGARSPLAEAIGDLNSRPHTLKTVPIKKGKEIDVAIWALTKREELKARKAAFDYVREDLKFTELDLAWDEQRAIQDAIMDEVLVVALRDARDPLQPFARSAQELRDRLSSQVIQQLFLEYLRWYNEQAWLELAEDPVGELDKLVDLVGKGRPASARVSRFDGHSLRELLLLAVDRLVSAATLSSSPTSPPSE